MTEAIQNTPPHTRIRTTHDRPRLRRPRRRLLPPQPLTNPTPRLLLLLLLLLRFPFRGRRLGGGLGACHARGGAEGGERGAVGVEAEEEGVEEGAARAEEGHLRVCVFKV